MTQARRRLLRAAAMLAGLAAAWPLRAADCGLPGARATPGGVLLLPLGSAAERPAAWQGEVPVLVVGNSHDPATSYASAQAVARLLPNSRLLSSTNWGHTAYGVSACATAHVDAYLVDGTLPPAGTLCSDGYEPLRP